MDPDPIECETCNDERELHVDCFDPSSGHFTRAVPCHDCDAGVIDEAALDTQLELELELAAFGGRVAELGARLAAPVLESRLALELRGLAPRPGALVHGGSVDWDGAR